MSDELIDEQKTLQVSEEVALEVWSVFPDGSSFSFLGLPGVVDEATAMPLVAQVKLLAWLLKKNEPRISYDGLKKIVFASDYDKALQDLGESFGHTIAATQERSGYGVAMVNRGPDGCVVTLAAGLGIMIMGDSEKDRNLAAQMIAHELCHVSDETYKRKVFGDAWDTRTDIFPFSSSLWSEYFANRHCASFITDPKLTTELLAAALVTIESDITAALMKYRVSHNLTEMMDLLRVKLRFLGQCIGYVAGVLHGQNVSLDVLDAECASVVRKSRIATIWDSLLDDLKALEATYDSWSGLSALEPLNRQAIATMKAFGFHLRTLENGALYVDIPLRSDGV